METKKRDILEGLNSAQSDAVRNMDGPSLIVAGAGSGKTRVLTRKIAYLIENGVRPSRILALTFTKKAAGEMKERIAVLVGENQARWIWMGTFHSIFIRFLREYADRLGYPAQFTIYDQSDSRSLTKQCVKELQLDDKIYKPNDIQNRISLAKNNLRTPSGYRADPVIAEEDRASRRPRLADVYDLYQKKIKAAGAMDFDDILLNTNILFRDHPDALAEIAGRFSHILVDEYQDTNFAQYLILNKLARGHRNISVVGDDSQSIYSFRGARIENILRFQKDYPEAKVFRLEENYRSTQNIVNAANSLIARNENRIKKECFSNASPGEKIHIIKAFTDQEEAYLTASSIIERIYSDKADYSSFAILYRTNAQSRPFEESLRRKNLPYRIYGGHSFFEREEIKDMLAYFKLVVNPQDDVAFSRIVNRPARGLGDTSLAHLSEAARSAQVPLFEAIGLPAEKLLAVGLKEGAIRKLREFAALFVPLMQTARTSEAFSLAAQIANASGYVAALRADTSTAGMSRLENVEALFHGVKEYSEEEAEMRREMGDDAEGEGMEIVTLSDYLENIYLLSEAEKDDLTDGVDSTNRITLMTVHAAKGLEFPYVYIAGMEENLFPTQGMFASNNEIEEERRLFYVALTRAEKVATVSFARSRKHWGKDESNPVSRFVREIDPRYLDGPVDDVERPSVGERDFRTDRNAGGYWERAMGYGSGSPQYVKSATRPMQTPPSRPQAPMTRQQTPVPQQRPSFSNPVNSAPRADFRPDPISELRAGQRVEHDRFGFGTILQFIDDGPNMKAIVQFDECGKKTLLLKFAKLRIDR
ncbi:MAG: UvrD-helicase domain-containing protein [Bacteroidales bacterium]|nr:UvrD-helicase domain-containing protein [Bacteroidales bacterium]